MAESRRPLLNVGASTAAPTSAAALPASDDVPATSKHSGEDAVLSSASSSAKLRRAELRRLQLLFARHKPVVVAGGLFLLTLVVIACGLAAHRSGRHFPVPDQEESGEDPYDMDGSWVKEIERKFRQEEQMRDRMLAAARRKRGRARQDMLARIPPSAFPEYHPKPRKTEAQREKELREKQLEDERRATVKMEHDAGEYKYLLQGRVRPPRSTVPNCPRCARVTPPRECGFVPRSREAGVQTATTVSVVNDFAATRRLQFSAPAAPDTNQVVFEEPGGVRRSVVAQWLKGWRNDPQCGFWTTHCVRKSLHEVDVLPFTKGPEELFPGHMLPSGGHRLFPKLVEDSLGTCALVGSGRNLLGKGRGQEIDQHDSVIRFLDAPVLGYEADVGNRTTLSVIKAGVSTRPGVLKALEALNDVEYFGFERLRDYKFLASETEAKNFTFREKKLLWMTEYPDQVTSRVYSLYKTSHPMFANHHKLVPTTGFRLFTALLASRLCSRIDLYGFSAAGAGKYHSPEDILNESHVAGLEHWLYRLAMDELMRVCPYD